MVKSKLHIPSICGMCSYICHWQYWYNIWNWTSLFILHRGRGSSDCGCESSLWTLWGGTAVVQHTEERTVSLWWHYVAHYAARWFSNSNFSLFQYSNYL